MSRPVLCTLMLQAILLIHTSAQADCFQRLSLVWVDPDKVVPDTRSLADEIRSIFQKTHVPVDWREYRGSNAPSNDTTELHVHLRTGEPTRWNQPKHAMGVTFLGPVRTQRLYVFFPALARTLGRDPAGMRELLQTRDDTYFTRALARVIAHEVFHAILATREHSDVGLTRGTLNRSMLLAEELPIDPVTVRAFRRRFAKGGRQNRNCASP